MNKTVILLEKEPFSKSALGFWAGLRGLRREAVTGGREVDRSEIRSSMSLRGVVQLIRGGRRRKEEGGGGGKRGGEERGRSLKR